jgi:hypothetical protein
MGDDRKKPNLLPGPTLCTMQADSGGYTANAREDGHRIAFDLYKTKENYQKRIDKSER